MFYQFTLDREKRAIISCISSFIWFIKSTQLDIQSLGLDLERIFYFLGELCL